MTLKEAIYKCLEAHLDPMTSRHVTEYIGRFYGYNTNDHTVSKTISGMYRDREMPLMYVWLKGNNGSNFKAWFIPRATQQEAQQEMF